MQTLENNCYRIKFLKNSLDDFYWPKNEDSQDVKSEYIFFGPITMIGSGTMQISTNDRSQIMHRYKSMRRVIK